MFEDWKKSIIEAENREKRREEEDTLTNKKRLKNPFLIVNDIMYNKKDLIRNAESEEMQGEAEKLYRQNSWIIDDAVSKHRDTILLASEMNTKWQLNALPKNDFYINTIRKKFRRVSKKNKEEEEKRRQKTIVLKNIMEYFGYGIDKAKDALKILSSDDIAMINDSVGSKENAKRRYNKRSGGD